MYHINFSHRYTQAMYSWDDDTSDWANPSAYRYQPAGAAQRQRDAARARAHGPRTYARRTEPDWQLLDPTRDVSSDSRQPMVIGVDVTASMAHWPAEIFDRLPLLFNTLSQYDPALELAFAAIGDTRAFQWPLQASGFGKGFDLERVLKGIYPEGQDRSSIDNPESYGIFARWLNRRVSAPKAPSQDPGRPFCIIFGDITMHPSHTPAEVRRVLGDHVQADIDCRDEFRQVAARWDTWFLRTARCWEPQQTDAQWGDAIGHDRILVIEDDLRAVDIAMALVAKRWGRLQDFRENLAARQPQDVVEAVLRAVGG